MYFEHYLILKLKSFLMQLSFELIDFVIAVTVIVILEFFNF